MDTPRKKRVFNDLITFQVFLTITKFKTGNKQDEQWISILQCSVLQAKEETSADKKMENIVGLTVADVDDRALEAWALL